LKKRILITGVQGFLGQAMFRYLSGRGDVEVIGLSRRPSEGRNVVGCDLLNLSAVRLALKKIRPQVIYHLAGGAVGREQEIWDANVITTQYLLQAAQDARVVVPGSAAEYGKASAKMLIKETQKPRPVAWYGYVKFEQTRLALESGRDAVVARIFNITGANISSRLVAGRFAEQIVKIERKELPKEIRTFGLNGQRDFVDVEDVCRALEVIAGRGQRGEVYHIASGRPTRIRRVLQILLSLSAVKDIRIIEEQERARSFDAIGSFSRLKKLGWKPEVTLRESLQHTLRGYREHLLHR